MVGKYQHFETCCAHLQWHYSTEASTLLAPGFLIKADWHCTWHKDAVASCGTASPDAHMQLAHNSNTHFWHLATLSTAQQIAVSASHNEVLVIIKYQFPHLSVDKLITLYSLASPFISKAQQTKLLIQVPQTSIIHLKSPKNTNMGDSKQHNTNCTWLSLTGGARLMLVMW